MLLFVVFLGLERHGVTLKEGDIDAVQWDRGLRFSAKILFQKGGSLRLERPGEPLEGGRCIYRRRIYFKFSLLTRRWQGNDASHITPQVKNRNS